MERELSHLKEEVTPLKDGQSNLEGSAMDWDMPFLE